MWLQILLILFVTWMLVLRWQNRGLIKLWNQLKNEVRAYPIIGHAYLFLGSDEDKMKVFQKYGVEAYKTGGLLAMWQGSRLFVNVSDPEIAELVLKTCLEKDDVMKITRLLTGNGIIFAPVSVWRPRRKLLAPTFSKRNLQQFVQIFSRQSDVMVDQLKETVDKGPFSIWKYITSYSMDSVCESTLGVQVNGQRQPDHPFIKAFEEICEIDTRRYFRPWLYNDSVYKMTPSYKQYSKCKAELYGFIDRIIKNKRQTIKEEKTKQPESDKDSNIQKSFLEHLIEASGSERGYTDLDLLEECLVLVLAGTDTSAAGIAFTVLMLARRPDIQEKVYQEIQEVLGNSNRPLVVADLLRLRYLEAVIKESLRLYPPVPFILRKVDKKVPLPSGIILVKGCAILVNNWAINRNPKYWGDDSMEYRPERWMDAPPKHPAAFMSFSYGPRGCVGNRYAMLSTKTAIAALLRNYHLLPAMPVGDKDAPLRTKFCIMLKHIDNYEVQLEKRMRSD